MSWLPGITAIATLTVINHLAGDEASFVCALVAIAFCLGALWGAGKAGDWS